MGDREHRIVSDLNPTWLVAEGVAHFDSGRNTWQIAYAMDDVRWEPRDA